MSTIVPTPINRQISHQHNLHRLQLFAHYVAIIRIIKKCITEVVVNATPVSLTDNKIAIAK